MFFEKESIQFHILDVLELKQKNLSILNSERNFSALSFRYRSNAVIETENEQFLMGDHCVTYVPARLDYKRSASVDELIVIHLDTTNYSSRGIESFTPKDPRILSELFRKILTLWNKKELGYRHRCAALLCSILAECYTENFVPKVVHSKIRNSVDYILSNYKSSDLSIKEAAEQSFMSEVYFRKLFKKEYGISPCRYIINLRIQNAVGLISAGYYSLKEVAYLSGYNDYKYFSVEFKKAMGISPSEYLYNYR